MQHLALAQSYTYEEEFHTNIKILTAFAFAVAEDTLLSFRTLVAHAGNEKQTVLVYFKSHL